MPWLWNQSGMADAAVIFQQFARYEKRHIRQRGKGQVVSPCKLSLFGAVVEVSATDGLHEDALHLQCSGTEEALVVWFSFRN